MPWMLQPKNYLQAVRPNLYNVAYRRVGTYKGMGRLHPTNYLQLLHAPMPGSRGHSTGQYNTVSGQLALLPPSLRGLGQAVDTSNLPLTYNYGYSTSQQEISLAQALGASTGTTIPTQPVQYSFLKQYGGYLAVGLGVVLLLGASRR